MNIKSAIERVEKLGENSKICDEIAYMVQREHETGSMVTILIKSRYVSIDRDAFLALLSQEHERNKSEREKLQPVIDMANAALKGILQ